VAALVVVPASPPRVAPAVVPADFDYVPDAATSVSDAQDVLVDQARSHVFVAQRDDGLLVLDLDGQPVTTITMPGPQSSLRLGASGDSLFVVASDSFDPDEIGNAIYRVDTTSLAVEEVADATFEYNCQFGPIQPLAGRLWYGTWCPSSTGRGSLGYVNLADGTLHDVRPPDPDIEGIYAFPGRDDRLALLVNRFVELVEVIEGRAVTVTLLATRDLLSFARVAGVSPDGAEIVVAGQTPGARRYSADDLTLLGTYDDSDRATAIAVRADHTVAIGSDFGPGLRIYRPGQAAPIRTYHLNPHDPWGAGGVVLQGVDWGTERLYAVRGSGDLFAFVPRLRSHLEVTVTGRDFRYGQEVPVSVTLEGPSTERDVVLWGVYRDATRQRVGEFEVPLGRAIRIDAVASRGGHFEATFGGNSEYDPTYATSNGINVTAQVASSIPSGRLVRGVHEHRVREPVVFRAKVRPSHAGDCLFVEVEVRSGGLWRDVTSSCVTLDERSAVVASFKGSRKLVGKKFRVRGTFPGDEVSLQASGRWRFFRFVR